MKIFLTKLNMKKHWTLFHWLNATKNWSRIKVIHQCPDLKESYSTWTWSLRKQLYWNLYMDLWGKVLVLDSSPPHLSLSLINVFALSPVCVAASQTDHGVSGLRRQQVKLLFLWSSCVDVQLILRSWRSVFTLSTDWQTFLCLMFFMNVFFPCRKLRLWFVLLPVNTHRYDLGWVRVPSWTSSTL